MQNGADVLEHWMWSSGESIWNEVHPPLRKLAGDNDEEIEGKGRGRRDASQNKPSVALASSQNPWSFPKIHEEAAREWGSHNTGIEVDGALGGREGGEDGEKENAP